MGFRRTRIPFNALDTIDVDEAPVGVQVLLLLDRPSF
jgi:hypothetical protein